MLLMVMKRGFHALVMNVKGGDEMKVNVGEWLKLPPMNRYIKIWRLAKENSEER